MKFRAVILLLLMLALSASALAEGGFSFGGEANYDDYTAFGGALIAREKDALYIMNEGAPSLLRTVEDSAERGIVGLIARESTLYALENTYQTADISPTYVKTELYALDLSGGADRLLFEIDLPESVSLFDDGTVSEVMRSDGILMDADALYLLYELPPETGGGIDFSQESSSKLIRVDLATGERSERTLPGAQRLIALSGGVILYAREDSETGDVALVAYDFQQNQAEVMMTIAGENDCAAQAFCMDAKLENVYYILDDALRCYARFSGEDVVVQEGMRGLAPTLCALEDGSLYVCQSDGAQAVKLKQSATGSLTVSGADEWCQSYRAAHPEIDVEIVEMNADKLIDVILTQSAVPDVFLLMTDRSTAYRSLLERGYLYEIDDAELTSAVGQMHADIADAVTLNGQCYALPVALRPSEELGVNRELWDELGLGSLPQTWTEFAQFLAKWPQTAEQHPDVCLISSEVWAGETDSQQMAQWLLEWMVPAYERYRQTQPEGTGYDTELFQTMMQAYEAIDFEAVAASLSFDDPDQALLYPFYECSPERETTQYERMPLTVDGGEPTLAAGLTLLVVNPYSQHKDEAMDFLKYVVANLADMDRIELMPDCNAPVRMEGYEQTLQEYQDTIDALKARREAAEADEQQEIDAEILRWENEIANLEENGYLASEASIQAYRQQSARMTIVYASELNSEEEQALYEVRGRYAFGQISLEDFIAQMNRRVVMREMEG